MFDVTTLTPPVPKDIKLCRVMSDDPVIYPPLVKQIPRLPGRVWHLALCGAGFGATLQGWRICESQSPSLNTCNNMNITTGMGSQLTLIPLCYLYITVT